METVTVMDRDVPATEDDGLPRVTETSEDEAIVAGNVWVSLALFGSVDDVNLPCERFTETESVNCAPIVAVVGAFSRKVKMAVFVAGKTALKFAETFPPLALSVATTSPPGPGTVPCVKFEIVTAALIGMLV